MRKGFLILLTFLAGCRTREPWKPNVLLITLDTFRADRINNKTPNLLKLARGGIWFRQADTVAPLTLPSHATILSGVLPLHHGLRNNGVGAFPSKTETLATLFSRAGYRTGAFVSSFVLDRRFGLARGFETYDDEIPRDPNDAAATFEAERRGGETVDRALAWLQHGDARPWLAWVHLYDAHAPYSPPAPFPPTYDGEIAYVDLQVGRLLAAIDRTRTIVVVVGDHGEALGEHGELTHGLLLYESTLHVPLIIAGPRIEVNEVQQPISTVEVAPKVAALAGLSMPAIEAKTIYAESEYAKTFGWSALNSIRSGDIKLIRGATSEMFDLRRDPSETRNILSDQRRAYGDLARRLDQMTKGAVTTTTTVDEETRAKLASLGYVAPRSNAQSSNRDPRAMAPLFRRFEEATWAMNGGRLTDAVRIFEQLVRDDPGNSVFRSNLARAYRLSGDHSRAIALYREAVALAPLDADAWYNLAAALQEAGKTDEAAIVIREALRHDARRPEARNILGIALIAGGNLKSAEEEFRAALSIDPRDARAYNNLGNVLRAMNRLDEAREAYRHAVDLAASYADPLNGLGVIDVQNDRPREAIAEFDAALRIAPDHYEAQLNRGIALKMSGEARAAQQQFRHLLSVLPKRREFDSQRNAARTLLGQ